MDIDNVVDDDLSEEELLAVLHGVMNTCFSFLHLVCIFFTHNRNLLSRNVVMQLCQHYSLISRIPKQIRHLREVLGVCDQECINHLRMSRGTFSRLCHLLETSGGLTVGRNSTTAEQVATFLVILAHHTKNCIVKSGYKRSGRTVSKHFHRVLNAIIKLHPLLLATPEPIDENCTNERWNYFQGCLGALDGTYVNATVPKAHRGRYRNRKGDIAVNILAVCDINLNYIYVLSGWEGSAADSRVLRDAISRNNGLRIPRGNYYLCDSGYTNGEGFLTPYRGIRYHIDAWGVGNSAPHNKEEYFNMKHCKARNVIERSFGILKKRWAILRSASFYPIKVQNRIIMACCLLHNFIRKTMVVDPMEAEVPENAGNDDEDGDDYINVVESSPEWSDWRNNLATTMYNDWLN